MAIIAGATARAPPLLSREHGPLQRGPDFGRSWRIAHCAGCRKRIRGPISIRSASGSGSYAPVDPNWGDEAGKDAFSKFSGYIAAAAMEEVEEWDNYDAEKMSKFFRKRPLLLLRRVFQLGTTLGSWAFLRFLDSQVGRSQDLFKKRAGQLRSALVLLGPAYVKIAQAVSSRQDVISPEYIAELSLLQDRIAPFSTEVAVDIIEEELGVPIDTLFSEISPQPVAAASLGQVYQARLRADGQEVAVKVQRPYVRAAITLDVFILRNIAGFARKIFRLNTDLQSLVDEWATSLFKEMDYRLEARNGKRFRKLFGGLPDVVVPEFYGDLTSRRVLTMQWLEGQRLADGGDLHLIEVGVNCSLTQLLDTGFYHADPHPGNLMKTPDGKLAYLDFGMMGEVKSEYRNGLIEAALHLINRDFDGLAGDFVTLGLLPATNDAAEVTNALKGVFQNAVSKGVRNISFGDLSGNLGLTMYKYSFQLPAYFSLVVRSLTVLEGIALSSDPNYKVMSSSYPWIARKVLTDSSPELRATLQALLYKDGSFRIDRLESLLNEALRNNVEGPAATTQGNAAVSKDLVKRALNFSLGDQGAYVRDMLLNEAAKGADALNRAVFDAAAEALVSQLPFALPVSFRFIEEEDLENLNNLQRFSSLVAGSLDGGSHSPEVSMVPSETEQESTAVQAKMSAILQGWRSSLRFLPLLSVFPELSFTAQTRALLLPADIAGRLASRSLARTIRSIADTD